MKFKYAGSRVRSHLRWATEEQLNLRWNEFVVEPFSNANTFFKSTIRSIGTSNLVTMSSSTAIQEVDKSLETCLEKITSHLTKYRDGVITFINNAFRHVDSYEDRDNFLGYMELSKKEVLRDVKTLSRAPLVSDVKRYYAGLDDIFHDHAAAIEKHFNKLMAQHNVKEENRVEPHIAMQHYGE